MTTSWITRTPPTERRAFIGRSASAAVCLMFVFGIPTGQCFAQPPAEQPTESRFAANSEITTTGDRRLSEIRYGGLDVLTADEVVKALRTTPEVYEATHHAIDEGVYRGLVVDAIGRGLIASGFHDATVQLDGTRPNDDISIIEVPTEESLKTLHPQSLSVTINEGLRYRFGTLQVSGAAGGVNTWLQRELTNHVIRDPKKKPEDYELTWRTGRQFSGQIFAMENVTKRIHGALGDFGLSSERVTVNYTFDRASGRVNGLVQVPADTPIIRLGEIRLRGLKHSLLDQQLRSLLTLDLDAPLDRNLAYDQVAILLQNDWVKECELRCDFPDAGDACVIYDLKTFRFVEDDNHSEVSRLLNAVYDQNIRGGLTNVKLVNTRNDEMRYTLVLTDAGAAIDITPLTQERSYKLRAYDDAMYLESQYRDQSESTQLRLPKVRLELGIVIDANTESSDTAADSEQQGKRTSRFDISFHTNDQQRGECDLSVRVSKAAWRDLFPPAESELVCEPDRFLIRHQDRTLTLDDDQKLIAFYDKGSGLRAFFGQSVRDEGERLRRRAIQQNESIRQMFLSTESTEDATDDEQDSQDFFFVPAPSGAADSQAKLWLGFANSGDLIRAGSVLQELMQTYALAASGRQATLNDRLDRLETKAGRGPLGNLAIGEIALRAGLLDRAKIRFTLARELASRPSLVSADIDHLIGDLIPLEKFATNFDVRAALSFAISAGMQRGQTSTEIARTLAESLPQAESENQRLSNFVRASTFAWTLGLARITGHCDSRLARISMDQARQKLAKEKADAKRKRQAQDKDKQKKDGKS